MKWAVYGLTITDEVGSTSKHPSQRGTGPQGGGGAAVATGIRSLMEPRASACSGSPSTDDVSRGVNKALVPPRYEPLGGQCGGRSPRYTLGETTRTSSAGPPSTDEVGSRSPRHTLGGNHARQQAGPPSKDEVGSRSPRYTLGETTRASCTGPPSTDEVGSSFTQPLL